MASTIAQRRALKEARRRKIVAQQRRQERDRMGAVSFDRVRRWAKGPIHCCLIQEGLFEHGFGIVVLARVIGIGEVAMGTFLVDIYCRGIKDAALLCIDLNEFDCLLGEIGRASPWEQVEPSYARKLLREAAGYGDSCGFSPHRDFTAADALFGDVRSDDCDTAFRFAQHGKPCYVVGPNESHHKIRKTLQRLRNRLGEDGFTFIVPIDELELAADDLMTDSSPYETPTAEIPF